MFNDEFLKEFENEMFDFLCNRKIHQGKSEKDTIIQDDKYRGLKMIDYRKFITALSILIIKMLH